ncbi:MAG: Gfo/Idh/MocA family oxidoreductase [Puniceicoccales bacterium]|jgi:predicted dehydrogenase|nr:Gfo/Idh/MocA family oxidoreductase [Puniceicoccales bacterium]
MSITCPISPYPLRRRSFIRGVLAAGAAPFILRALPENLSAASRKDAKKIGQKVRIAYIGIGNQGKNDIEGFAKTGLVEVVALCDTELGHKRTQHVLQKYPHARQYRDFRKLLDEVGGRIDAVLVATPDFSHFPAAIAAMALGKHVYVEKPIAQSFRQIELLMAAEKKYGVVTQMGNQGHSGGNYYQFKAWTEAGVIKNITRINAHMNAARRWHKKSFLGMKDFFPAQPVPEWLDWEAWLSTALEHPYNPGYLNGDWRCWFEFGNGALGDWGAHIFDTAHRFLQLGLPREVNPLRLEGRNAFIFPQASTLEFKFAARGEGRPACTLAWYDGKENPPPLPKGGEDIEVDADIPPPGGGSSAKADKKGKSLVPNNGKELYAADGTIFQGGTHGRTLRALDPDKAREFAKVAVPRVTSDHFKNFLLATLGAEEARAPFSVSGPLCQVMNLGVIAQRVGERFAFDPATKRITNHEVADKLLDGVPPRKGWEQFYKLA